LEALFRRGVLGVVGSRLGGGGGNDLSLEEDALAEPAYVYCCIPSSWLLGSLHFGGCFAALLVALVQRMLCRWVVLLRWMLCHLLLGSGGCFAAAMCLLWTDALPSRLWLLGGCFATCLFRQMLGRRALAVRWMLRHSLPGILGDGVSSLQVQP
jgi:hypothetical protein